MYVCNTGLECEDCVGGCKQNLEWENDLTFLLLPFRNFKNDVPQKDEHKQYDLWSIF